MTCRAPSSGTTCTGTPTGASLSFDPEGMLAAWQNAPSAPTTTAAFLYDGQGTRVEQQVTQSGTTTTTVYVGNVEQVATTGSTTTTTTYYYAGSARIAEAVNGVSSYLASDGIGGADVALNAGGSATASQLFAPYGGSRYSSGSMPTDYGFTGQHTDSATGLDYYISRYYDPAAGQFTSPDTVLSGNGYHIWGLSRYAYVEGNPETRNDPTGRCPFCIIAIGAIAGAAVGAAISYGSQVVGNLQHGDAHPFTDVDVHEIAKAALVGAVVGGTGALAATLLAGAGVSIGLSIAASMAIGAGEGAIGQVGDNLLHGRAWHQGVAQAAPFGAATGGVGAVAGLGLRQLVRRFAGTLMRDGDTAMKGPISCATSAALSFSADTPVATPDGPKPIASLKVGDQVLAYDPQSKQVSAQTIEQVFLNHDSDRVDVTLETTSQPAPALRRGTDGGAAPKGATRAAQSIETIHTTANHPWLTADRGWVDAGAVRIGEPVQLASGQNAVVDAVRELPGSGAMYDLGLWQIHTFAVGGAAYVVHNANCGGWVRIRHYTNRRGLEGIMDDQQIKASRTGKVYAESARTKPLSPRDAERRYGLRRGRGRDYVETDVESHRVRTVYNPITQMYELQIQGDVPLVNARLSKRLE